MHNNPGAFCPGFLLEVEVLIKRVFTYHKKFNELLEQKRLVDAESFLNELTFKTAWEERTHLASLKFAQGDMNEAVRLLKLAVRQSDAHWAPSLLLAKALVKVGKPKDALPHARAAYESVGSLEAGHVYIHCLLDIADTDKCLEVAEKLLNKAPRDRHLLLALSSANRAKGNHVEALKYANDLLQVSPNDDTGLRLLADIKSETDSLEGLALYERALAAQQENSGRQQVATKWNMALHLLRCKELERGWEYWELGATPEVGTMGRNFSSYLNGATRADQLKSPPEKGQGVIVVAEQGIGDQVLFYSALQDCMNEFENVMLLPDPRMTSILTRSFPGLKIIPPGILEAMKTLRMNQAGWIPAGSLLPRYRKSVKSYKVPPYLRYNEGLAKEYYSTLRKGVDDRPVIGISWRGGYWNTQKKSKSLSLEHWKPILSKKARFVNLQYGDTTAEQEWARQNNIDLVTVPQVDFKLDIDRWMAIAAACDGIISVSTALVHFTGASGMSTLIVMPEPQGPWVLGLKDKKHMVYSNTEIYRRRPDESYQELFLRVARAVR